MQDVTDLAFLKLMAGYGGADVYVTEFFRVHQDSRLDREILRSITENPTGRPVVAQILGNDIPHLVRTANELAHYPIAAVDLNLGCPAPVVYKKCAGGGLLREPDRVDRILGALREAIPGRFTVKTRIGFDDPAVFDRLLPIFARHNIDLLTVHARTVGEMYGPEPRYEFVAQAVASLKCPVVANGNIDSPEKARAVLEQTGAHGLMVGRGAIRNPWIFTQIRRHLSGQPVIHPTGKQVLHYLHELYATVTSPEVTENLQVQKMKKYVNFLGQGVPGSHDFLHRIRRAQTQSDFFAICREFLDHDTPMALSLDCGSGK